MANPWLTSDDIVAAVKRRISFPVYQSTFTSQEILEFANDAMREEILPNMLQYHEEFFVTSTSTPLIMNQSVYPIPNRATGMKLRDLLYADGNTTAALPYGNIFEMTRINADDKAWFQSSGNVSSQCYEFYLEGNNVVVIPSITSNPAGILVFYWFMRPNQLVENSRAFIVSAFSKTITVDNAFVTAGDTITLSVVSDTVTTSYIFTAVAGAPASFEFQIAGTSSATATNLSNAINLADIGFSANNGTPASNIITVTYSNRRNTFETSDTAAFAIQLDLGLESDSDVPANIVGNSYVDLLQTLPGHKTLAFDIFVDADCIGGSTICIEEQFVPNNFVIGDYICSRNECIIPQVPPEIHSSLVQRVCSRILEAIGDKEGMAVADQKIERLNKNEPMVVDDRVDGAPQKVINRHSILRNNSFTRRRRY